MRQDTLYEALGGFQEVLRLAHAWHERVMKDAVVSHAFSHGFHPQHTERLAAYWTEALGGPALYTEKYGTESLVIRMHSGNGEHQEMDDRAIECFSESLKDIAIQDAALQKALLDYFTWTTKNTMAAYPHSKSDVPSGLQVPRWTWSGLQQ